MRYQVTRMFLNHYGFRWCVVIEGTETVIHHFKLHYDAALCAWAKNTPKEQAA